MFSRSTVAHSFMILAILLIGVGGFLLHPGIGILVGGVACGIYGYLLGDS